jgi:DNA-binding MarR family transcriptional regulator
MNMQEACLNCQMPTPLRNTPEIRAERNRRLYRSLTRTLREYNRRLVDGLHARGYTDFSPAFPALLSNIDLAGTPIGVAAKRAGVSRQAVGQLLREIERCGYARRERALDDARVTIIRFTARGRRMLATVLELVDEIEHEFARELPRGDFARVQAGMKHIADSIDPGGALGVGDLDAP